MLKIAETREAILKWISRPQYVPAKMLVVAQQIGILKEDFKEFQKLVRTMHKQELLRFGAGHVIWPILDQEQDERRVVGYFKRHPEGYGFVSEVELNPNTENIRETDEDVFIPPGKARDASTGDFVAVILDEERPSRSRHEKRGAFDGRDTAKMRRRGRSGAIEEVLERKSRTFVGTFLENHDGCFVEVDGRIFPDPIRISDLGGTAVRPGDKVVVEILNFPTAWRTGEGVLTEVLGPRGDVKTDTMAVMRQYGLPDGFPEPVLAEARWVADQFEKWEKDHQYLLDEMEDDAPFSSGSEPEWTKDGRRNLRDLFTLTIDPEDARDFDDAISIEMLEDGKMRLAVHIADVSHFVPADSQMDREAFDRGNSVYLPDRVIPMLPEILCNGIASLQPDRLRLAKTTFMTFSPMGVCLDVELCDSVICSNARLNYEQVDRFFEGDRSELPERVQDALAKFRFLAKILRDRRSKKGKLEMNLPEIRLELDRDGRVVGVRRMENTESHQMIEEFMVSTNEAVAQELISSGSNLMRRVHKAPSMEKFDSLSLFLEELGIYMTQKADRFELQHILEKTAGTPNEFAVHQAILRTMSRAVYSPEEEGHYALASSAYCHFTSPIRRYADLTIHRQIENFILGEPAKRNFRKIYDEGNHLTWCESNAEEAERELTRMKMVHFFAEKGDVELEARIVGVTHHGFFVECVDYPISGLVSVNSLPADRYRFDVKARMLSGFHLGNCFRLGDLVTVQIADLNVERREIRFELATEKTRRLHAAERNDLEELEEFPSWDVLDDAENEDAFLPRDHSERHVPQTRVPAAFETIHTRMGSKKARKALREMENAEDARSSGTSGKRRSTGTGGGKKSGKDRKKMTRKCKNCAPKGKKR